MTSMINYLIEANLALVILGALYYAFLRNETDFRIVRIVMVGGLLLSLIVPLVRFQLNTPVNIPAVENLLPELLPTVTVGPATPVDDSPSRGLAAFLPWIYYAGVGVSLIVLLIEIVRVARLAHRRKATIADGVRIIELPEQNVTFSFFNTIFFGSNTTVSTEERRQIIRHESVHIRQWHALDLCVVSLLRIVCWFNPVVHYMKKIFVQIHEFEADARAVKDQDLDRYCNLLARVALQSAGISLANHFNNSITLKRIQMMRTAKSTMRYWKRSLCAIVFLGMFVLIACQDQVGSESTSKDVPDEAQNKFELFKSENTGTAYLVEYDANVDKTLSELEAKHGLAKHIELFTVTDKDNNVRTFSMIVYDQGIQVQPDGRVFKQVDHMPEFPGGWEQLGVFIRDNLKYPLQARRQGIEGTCMIQFVVEKNGVVSGVSVLKGIHEECDAESARVVKLFPRWIPGTKDGEVVRTELIMPIKFKL